MFGEAPICLAITPHGVDMKGVVVRVLRRSCGQVGRGLAFLHASGIVHGNLSSSSVLLRKSTLDRRGFIAKIGVLLPCTTPGTCSQVLDPTNTWGVLLEAC